MNLSTFISTSASDEMLLSSVADYFESKVSSAIELVEHLADVVENFDLEGYQPPDLSKYALSYDDGVRLTGILANDVRDAIMSGADVVSVKIDNVVQSVPIEEIISQLSDSLQTNRVMTESIHALISSGSDSASAILSDFTNRITLQMGEVSDSVQSMAASFIGILTATGVSVGDRVRNLLQYVGMYSINTSDAEQPPIGLPNTELHDITGANVFQAFFAAFPDRISKIGEWLKDTAKKILQVMDGIVQTVLGSSGYRAIKKFIGTITSDADSFAYNTGDEAGLSIGSHGFTCVMRDFDYNNISWLKDLNLSTIHGQLMAICRAMGVTPAMQSTIQDLCSIISQRVGDPLANTPYAKLYAAVIDKGHFTSPTWILERKLNYPSGSIGDVVFDAFYFLNAFIRYNSNAEFGIFDALNRITGAVLDANHINDNHGFMSKLESTNYVTIDLPCSTLFFWLVGAEVYVTRRVTPCTAFMDSNWNLIENEVLSAMSTASGRSGAYHVALWINGDTVGDFLSLLRTTSERYVSTDVQMAKAIYASNIADSMYLSLLTRAYRSGTAMGGEIEEIFNAAGMFPRGGVEDQCFAILTGRSFEEYKNTCTSLSAENISNLKLCDILGATLGVRSLSGGDASAPFQALLHYATDESYFIPYRHVTSIPTGRYRVVTDKELRNVFGTLLEVTAVVAGALLVIQVAGKLKRQSMAARTKADANAWNRVTEGRYDKAAIKEQFKLQKKASLMEQLASALFNGVGKVVKWTTSNIKSMVVAASSKLRSVMSGEVDGNEKDVSLYDIKRIITGS